MLKEMNEEYEKLAFLKNELTQFADFLQRRAWKDMDRDFCSFVGEYMTTPERAPLTLSEALTILEHHNKWKQRKTGESRAVRVNEKDLESAIKVVSNQCVRVTKNKA